MKFKLKVYRAILHTTGKTSKQILKDFDGPKPSDEVVQHIIKAYDIIDGLEVAVTDTFVDNGYSLVEHYKKDNEKFKEFIYLLEQDPFVGTYVNDREQFDKDWNSGEYEPPAALHFDNDDVEIIEELN